MKRFPESATQIRSKTALETNPVTVSAEVDTLTPCPQRWVVSIVTTLCNPATDLLTIEERLIDQVKLKATWLRENCVPRHRGRSENQLDEEH